MTTKTTRQVILLPPAGQERGLTRTGKKAFICLPLLFPRDHLSSSSREAKIFLPNGPPSPSSTRLIRAVVYRLRAKEREEDVEEVEGKGEEEKVEERAEE